MKKQFILLAVVGLVLTSCGIYTKYQRPEDITTDGLMDTIWMGKVWIA